MSRCLPNLTMVIRQRNDQMEDSIWMMRSAKAFGRRNANRRTRIVFQGIRKQLDCPSRFNRLKILSRFLSGSWIRGSEGNNETFSREVGISVHELCVGCQSAMSTSRGGPL